MLAQQKKQYMQTRLSDSQVRNNTKENDENQLIQNRSIQITRNAAQISSPAYNPTYAAPNTANAAPKPASAARYPAYAPTTPLRERNAPSSQSSMNVVPRPQKSPQRSAPSSKSPKKTNMIDDISSFREYAEMERKLGSYLIEFPKSQKELERQHAYLSKMDQVSVNDDESSCGESADGESIVNYSPVKKNRDF
jgi:hypothetical protein